VPARPSRPVLGHAEHLGAGGGGVATSGLLRPRWSKIFQGRGLLPVMHGPADERDGGEPDRAVLPRQSGLRQWVLTFPFPWRRRLAQDGALLGNLTRIFVETVHALYAERAAREGALGQSPGRSRPCRGPRRISG